MVRYQIIERQEEVISKMKKIADALNQTQGNYYYHFELYDNSKIESQKLICQYPLKK